MWWPRVGNSGASTLPTFTRPASDRNGEPGFFSASAHMAGYPKVYNIEMDPHEDLVVGGLFSWVSEPALKVVDEYLER